MNFWVGLALGLFLGAFLMMLAIALCMSSRQGDEQMEEFNRKEVEDSIDE